MAKARMGTGLVTACLLLWGSGTPARAAPTAAQMLGYRPKQDGIVYSTPTAQEMASCKVELVQGPGRSSGWLVRDPQGLPLRRFFDSNGDNKIDVWSYYDKGVEVYREIDSDFNGKVDQYRWLNTAGMRWGLDLNEDGKIDTWKMISAEEVSQEILQAVATKDFARLQALWITEAELKALDLPASEVGRLQELQKQAPAKFQSTVSKLSLDAKPRWIRLETAAPQCLLAETTGAKQDLLKYAGGTVLYEIGSKQDWLQTGELMQVGLAWRIIDAPTPDAGGESKVADLDPAMKKLLDDLRELDRNAPKQQEAPGPNPALVQYNVQRAALIDKILAKVTKPEDRENWIRQQADSLSTAAQSSAKDDKDAFQRLLQLEAKVVKDMPNSALAAYVTFREMTADYAAKLAAGNGSDFTKVQEAWLERLKKFVETYNKADDTPDALLQLGMVSEFVGKETDAKNWYEQLADHFPGHPLAVKAKGARKRLELEGKPLELASATLGGSPFDLTQVKDKVLVVYYWASWNGQCVGDFAKLKLLLNTYGPKGLELVCVNLDNTADEAKSFLDRSPSPGVQLFQPGGLESRLAKQYGIMVLPNLFLVGKDGKVVSRTVQMSNLEEEVKKLVK
jgi:thiol-disulfide isomerase/thioredoxin